MSGTAVATIMKDQNQVKGKTTSEVWTVFQKNSCIKTVCRASPPLGWYVPCIDWSQRGEKILFYLQLNAQSTRCEGSLRMETPIKKKLGWLKKNLKLILAAILVELIAHFLIEGGVSFLFNKFHGSDVEDECRCNKSSHGHSHNNWMPQSDGRYPQNPSSWYF